MVRNRRRRKSKGKSIILTVLVLGLLVFFGADNFGFDWFNFKINLNKSATKTESSISDNKTTSTNKHINIVVKEDIITLNDEVVDLTSLKKQLDNYKTENTIVNLMDNSAYITSFTEVETLLSDKGYKVIVYDVKE